MITAIVRFSLLNPMSAETATERFMASAPNYQNVAGLTRKHYLRSPDGTTGGGVYLWESQAQAEAFYNDEWKQSIELRFGSEPTIEYFEVPVTVDPSSIT